MKVKLSKILKYEDLWNFYKNNLKNFTIIIFNEIYILYLGGWFKDNKFYLDISIVENNREKAINIGKYCNQKAIYDIENKTTIYLHE